MYAYYFKKQILKVYSKIVLSIMCSKTKMLA